MLEYRRGVDLKGSAVGLGYLQGKVTGAPQGKLGVVYLLAGGGAEDAILCPFAKQNHADDIIDRDGNDEHQQKGRANCKFYSISWQ